jgi:hypothetical protein
MPRPSCQVQGHHVQRVRQVIIICVVLSIVLLLTTETTTSTSQFSEQTLPQFGGTLVKVHQAEASGANRQEITGLVLLLNKALEVDAQAGRPSTPEGKRAALLAQVNETLAAVDTEANRLEVTASQRVTTNRVIAYVSGGIAALAGTAVYLVVGHIWRKYRVKRTFQMRIYPK